KDRPSSSECSLSLDLPVYQTASQETVGSLSPTRGDVKMVLRSSGRGGGGAGRGRVIWITKSMSLSSRVRNSEGCGVSTFTLVVAFDILRGFEPKLSFNAMTS
ncbi:hypothetical protein RRG08_005329, partial [Elysia crispata]